MRKVFYMFPEGMTAGAAARAYMEAEGKMDSTRYFLNLKYEIEQSREVFIPRSMAETLKRKHGGAIYEMPAAGAVT